MNCPEVVDTVTGGGGFPWILLAAAIIVGGFFLYKEGIVGTETSLKALADKLKAKGAKIEAKWKAKLAAKAAPAPAPAVAVPAKTKAERIAENNALVGNGITKEQADAANAVILAE